jgi:hypothetical protein
MTAVIGRPRPTCSWNSFHGGPRRLRRGERVDHDPAGLAAHERDVGEVEAAHLVDPGDHLVQPVVVVERGDPHERRMDRVEPVALQQELEPLHVPGDVAGVGRIFMSFIGAMKPRSCSAKSRLSPNGSVVRDRSSTSRVNFDGALPFGSKCSGGVCASAALAPARAQATAANATPTEARNDGLEGRCCIGCSLRGGFGRGVRRTCGAGPRGPGFVVARRRDGPMA